MAAVFVVGAETLAIPADETPLSDANAARFQAIYAPLAFELHALFTSRYMTALGVGSDSALKMYFDGTGPSVVPIAPTAPSQIHPVLTVATADAITGFQPDLIIELPGGIAPSSAMQATIAGLQSTAAAGGTILWRQLHDIPSPLVQVTAYYQRLTLATAVVSVPGRVLYYPVLPASVQYALDGGAPNTVAVGTDGTFHIPVARLAVGGQRTLVVSDPAYPSISATATLQF